MANSIEIRQRNRNNIFRLIYQEKIISKQEIAKKLNLSMPTVTNNLSDLFDRNLLCINGTFESTGGRKARAICCNDNAKCVVGIDITKNHISGVLVNLNGEILYSERRRQRFETTGAYYQALQQLVQTAIGAADIPEENILGVGISVPAIIADDNKTSTYAPIVDVTLLYEDLEKYLTYPYQLFNDSKAGGFAELWHAKPVENMVYLSLSNSVGGAVLMKNGIYYGENRHSGEWGHMTLIPNGKTCYCGKKGCADVYCNAQNLSDLTDGDLKRFFECLDAGEEKCVEAWDRYLDYLSMAINNIRNILECDVVLGGYVGGYIDKYMDDLRERVAKRSTFGSGGEYIKCCHFKNESSAVGAALYLIGDFIERV